MKTRFNINKLKRALALSAFLFSMHGYAQDIQFSQFYTAALYQNPAFAGASHHHRGMLHQRLQWPGLEAKYITSMLSYDTYFHKHRSGFGIIAMKDWQGSSNISSTDIGLQYAYELHITPGLAFRPGLQVSYVSRNLNYTGLTLPQDYTSNGYVGGSTLQGGDNKRYADISSGGILYSDNIWVGFSAHHINRPNQSLIKGSSRLPTKYALTGGYKIRFKKSPYHNTVDYLDHHREYSITPTFHYKFQGESDQLDLGIYGMYDFLLVGFWYRGIPVIKYYNKEVRNNSESMIVMAGWKYEKLSVTYSYDFTVSRLVRAGTAGSHELNITYLYQRHKKHKIMKRLPCPNFNHR